MLVTIHKHNNLSIQIEANIEYVRSVRDYFSGFVDGYQFMPAFKNSAWDGKISLLDLVKKTLPYGLLIDLIKFHRKAYPDTEIKIDDDVLHLFRGLSTNIDYDLKFEPHYYQKDCIEAALKYKRGIIRSATACHAKGDKIIMSNGTVKNIEDIKIGEYVIGKDGNPKKVINIFSGQDDLYKIIPKNNRTPITVTKNHLLHLSFTPNKKYTLPENISVHDYIEKGNWYKHISKLTYLSNEIKFTGERTNCKLSPYFIGLYIGDGSTHSCSITNIDKECIKVVYNEAKRFNMEIIKKDKYTYNIKGSKNKRNIIFSEFDKLGLNFGGKNKIKCGQRFLPKTIFNQTINYRKNVLAGLIDADGCLNNTHYEITSKSKKLIDDIELLSVSLGLTCSKTSRIISLHPKHHTRYYTIYIMGNISKIPVKIKRKVSIKKSSTNAYRSAFTIKYIGIKNFYGLQVEDSLYITNNGMITHNSGKSLIIAHIIKTLMEHNLNKKALIIVPTISLVEQFYDDLLEYGYFTKDCLGKVYEKYKEFGRPVVISTWQTLSRNHNRLSEFECVICDEVHGAKAHEIKKILNLCTGADYRLGFTGTMPLSDLDIWNVKAYLGPVIREYGAGQLGREGYISKANIVIVDINYQNEYKGSYDDVKDEIFKNPFRLGVLKNIINASKGNILLLVGKVEKEGALLKEYLDKQTDHNALKKDVVFLHGSTKVQEREYWRKECEKRKNIVLIATYGIFQQGINIPSLKYIVLASPYKSKIRVLQSIGRGLRKHKSKKDGAYIYDIFDDCKYLYDHGVKRERHYNAEGFDVTDIVLQEGEHIDPSLFKV